MMTITVEVLREFGLTVSERKTETLVMRVKEKQPPLMPPPPLIIEAAGQRYAQTTEFRYVGGLVNEQGDLTREIHHKSKAASACLKRYKTELFDRPGALFDLKARLLKAEAVGALLHGCVTWSPRRDHYRLLQTRHHQLLLRIIGHLGQRGTHRQLSYGQALRRATLSAALVAAMLATAASFGTALISSPGNQPWSLRRIPSRHAAAPTTTRTPVAMRVSRNEDSSSASGISISGLSGLGRDRQESRVASQGSYGSRSSSTSSRFPQGSLLRRQVFWDGLLEAGESGRNSKKKSKPKRPDPPGFPPASTLLRPVLEEREHFLDISVEKFKPNKPSWGQAWRFRLQPFGRLSSRTKIVQITLKGSVGLTSQPQLFKEPELTLFALVKTLKTAAHDPRIKAVLIEFEAPVLSMAATMEVRRAMDYFVQSGKPLWGFTESSVDMTLLCLMGGCTRRIATEEAYCNVIGFSTEAQFFRKAFENFGIEPTVKRIGEFKSFGDAYSRDSMSKAQREVSTNLLETVSRFKTGLLARSSGKSLAEVEKLYDNDVPLDVKMLRDFGLLDDVYYRDQMLSLLAGEVSSDKRRAMLIKRAKRDGGKNKGKLDLGVGSPKLIIGARQYLKRVRKNRVEGVPGLKGDKTIAVLNAQGAIVNSAAPGPGGGDNLVISNFREMASQVIGDKSINGVVVRVSSPGGDASASDLMWREVRRLRESGKVVVASVADVAASGGYYIAMGCERIVCDDLSITGSIGVVLAVLKIEELLEKIGVASELISKGKYAEIFAPRRFTPQEDAYFGRGAMASYNDFVGKAAASRRMPLEDMQRRAQGRVWTGVEAKALGLVDDLGGLDKAIEVCRDMVDLKDLATKKMKEEMKKERNEKKESKGKESSPVTGAPAAESSTAIVKSESKGKDKGVEGFDESDIIYTDDEVPFGPLGVFPENYTELQAKVVKEAEKELQAAAEKRQKEGKERLTRVVNVQPSSGGVLGPLRARAEGVEGLLAMFGVRKKTPAASNNASILLKGLGSLMSPEASRPMAVLDDNVARVVPGISGVPEELRNLGVGPTLYSVLLRSPGLPDALVEMAAKLGLSGMRRLDSIALANAAALKFGLLKKSVRVNNIRTKKEQFHLRVGGTLLGSGSTPSLGRNVTNQPDVHAVSKAAEEDGPLPPLGGWAGGIPPRPSTTTGAFGRPSSSSQGSQKSEEGEKYRLWAPPRSSPGLSRKEAGLVSVKGGSGASSSSAAPSPLNPKSTATNDDAGATGGQAGPLAGDGHAGIPLGLSKLDREGLELTLRDKQEQTRQRHLSRMRQFRVPPTTQSLKVRSEYETVEAAAAGAVARTGVRAGAEGTLETGEKHPDKCSAKVEARVPSTRPPRAVGAATSRGKTFEGGYSVSSSVEGNSSNSSSAGGDMKWFARSKGSKTLPLRTLMLDQEVNNIPQVSTQSDFQALIKAQNIPHPSYDIDGDGVVSQEDYALAKRFDTNGDGILDEAEKVVGRRIMTEVFLDSHEHDIHLYGQGLSQKSMAANVDDISRSPAFKKIISGLREKEKNLANHGSDGVRECVTLKPSLTRHNFFSNKFDTTAWNDFTRDPRDADWLESRRHDGSRNQMYFMRKVEARESAQGKLNASYRGDDNFSTRRIMLISDPAVENS
eukprot:g14405.t1